MHNMRRPRQKWAWVVFFCCIAAGQWSLRQSPPRHRPRPKTGWPGGGMSNLASRFLCPYKGPCLSITETGSLQRDLIHPDVNEGLMRISPWQSTSVRRTLKGSLYSVYLINVTQQQRSAVDIAMLFRVVAMLFRIWADRLGIWALQWHKWRALVWRQQPSE